MEDFYSDEKLRKQVLIWCEKNLFIDANDYVPRKKIKTIDGKKNIDVFFNLSVTTWMLIINDKINDIDFSIRPNDSKENTMRNLMFFLLNMKKSLT